MKKSNKQPVTELRFSMEAGKQRVINMLTGSTEDIKQQTLKDIQMVIEGGYEDILEEIEDYIAMIRTIEKNTNNCIEKIKKAYSIEEILNATKDTPFEDMELTILSELFGVQSITSCEE